MTRTGLGAGAITLAALLNTSAFAAPPAPYEVTPDLIAAANKEGAVTYYGTVDIEFAEKIAAVFHEKYPGIKVDVERAGAERMIQRIEQEYQSNIHNCDVIETSDASQFLMMKSQKMLIAAPTADIAKYWPASAIDPDGTYAPFRATLTVLAYRSDLVKPEDAPKTWMDLLEPKYKGKIVKASPSYSGNNLIATYALSKALGWGYYEKLAKQNIMQVQSATEPPKVLSQGERQIQADGNEYLDFLAQNRGVPIKIVYPPEGTPIAANEAGILAAAPHPNAARLFYAFMFSHDGQQLSVDFGGRSFRPDIKEKPSVTPLSQIKILYSDPAAVADASQDVKDKYEEYFTR